MSPHKSSISMSAVQTCFPSDFISSVLGKNSPCPNMSRRNCVCVCVGGGGGGGEGINEKFQSRAHK